MVRKCLQWRCRNSDKTLDGGGKWW